MSAARITVWSEDDCRRVHEATLKVLAETGIDVRYAPALEVFAAAGGRVDGTRVRLDAAAVDKALASAPRTWTVRSRGRDEALELRNGNTYFGTGSDCLFYRDPDSGERRRVRNADIEEMAALCEQLPTSTSSCRWACPRTRRSRSTTCRPSPRCSPARASRSWWRRATAASSRPSRTCAPPPARPTAS